MNSLFVLVPVRSLGVHCSKVRSLTLDSWEPELLKVLTLPVFLLLPLSVPEFHLQLPLEI